MPPFRQSHDTAHSLEPVPNSNLEPVPNPILDPVPNSILEPVPNCPCEVPFYFRDTRRSSSSTGGW